MINKIFLLGIVITVFFSCEKDISSVSDKNIPFPPDKNLSVSDILKYQKIESLHFTQWDSISINNKPDDGYSIAWEVYLDSEHIRSVQYYTDGRPWIITVIDLEKWNTWQYDLMLKVYDKIQFPDTIMAFENITKRHLISRLTSNLESIKYIYLGNYYCHLVKDSLENVEWIWTEHGLPIKWETTNYPDGIKVNAHRILKDIEINKDFPDSLFTKP
jgi:hypothetical protein